MSIDLGANKPRIAVIQFPGSNCDSDCFDALHRHFGIKAEGVWHQDRLPDKTDAIVLPGGFSYGDYLRGGALASHSPIMEDVKAFVDKGGPAIGICNGFQVLTESGLLPGALLTNSSQKFVCKITGLAAGEGKSTYQAIDQTLRIPVAHGEGRYYIDDEGLARLKGEGLVAYRYVDADGNASADANPNGAVDNIAGVVSENGRVLGLMPHPERACDELLGSDDGLRVWESFFASFL